MRDILTLEEFRATRQACADLGVELNDSSLEGIPGWTYVWHLHILRHPDGPNDDSIGHLIIGRSEYFGPIETLEKTLYLWAEEEELSFLRCANKLLPNHIADAAKITDLDEAARHVMRTHGIFTGDIASQCLSGHQDQWADLTEAGRRSILTKWVKLEIEETEEPFTDPENIYNSDTMRQSIEEDRK